MPKLTPEQLAEIAERFNKIEYTGQWQYFPEENVIWAANCSDAIVEEISHGYEGEFIAASRTDIPALLDHIKALEEENGRYKEVIETALQEHDHHGTILSGTLEEMHNALMKGVDEE